MVLITLVAQAKVSIICLLSWTLNHSCAEYLADVIVPITAELELKGSLILVVDSLATLSRCHSQTGE